MSRSIPSRAALCLALALAPACAGAARDAYVHEQAAKVVYERPADDVLTAAKALLAEEGYSGRAAAGGRVFVTEWREQIAGSAIAATYTRYLVEVREVAPGRTVARFLRSTRSAGASGQGVGQAGAAQMAGMSSLHTESGASRDNAVPEGPSAAARGGTGLVGGPEERAALLDGKRDLEMEWRLLGRLAPDRARALEAEAHAKSP
jgi:hypothetical protein